jgi:hypothetical protein
LSLDGQTAASCDRLGRGDVILWNATTGNCTRQIKPDWPSYWQSLAVTVSNNADWTLVVGTIKNDPQLRLLDSAGKTRSQGNFRIEHAEFDDWSASFTPDGYGCTLLIENHKEGTREMHEWTILAAVIVKVKTATLTYDLPSPCLDALGKQELLLKGKRTLRFAVCRAARGKKEHCTCTAVAHFDTYLQEYCAWSGPHRLSGSSPSARHNSTVVVGLYDGTVHIMEFRV